MADTTQQSDASQNGLVGFNWDDSSSDSFFGLSELGNEIPKDVADPVDPKESDEKGSNPKDTKGEDEGDDEDETGFFGSDDGDEDEGSSPKTTGDSAFYEDVYKDLREAGIFKHVELEEGEQLDAERLYELQQEEYDREVEARLSTWASKDLDEDAQAFIKFKLQGGDTSEFFKTYQSTTEFSPGDVEDEDYQDNLIRYQLQKEGWDRDEIEDRIEFLTDSNKKAKFAEKYHNRLLAEQKEEKAAILKQQEAQKAKAKKQEEEFKQNLRETLEANKEINGIKIVDKERDKLINFITKREKLEDGRVITGFQRKLSESFNDPKKLALLAKILSDDFNFSSFEKSAISKKTKEIKRNIEQRQSMRPTGSGSSSGLKDLASLFEK